MGAQQEQFRDIMSKLEELNGNHVSGISDTARLADSEF